MPRSIQEEILAVLWGILAALVSIADGPPWAMKVCTAIAFFNLGCATYEAVRANAASKRARIYHQAQRERRMNGTSAGSPTRKP